MKTIIAGSKTITDKSIISDAIEKSGFKTSISEIVSGRCRGVDMLGESFAKELGVGVKPFPADWDRYGRGAGMIRNTKMVNYANALIAIWDGYSKGTKNIIDKATKKGLKVYIHLTNNGC